MLSMLFLEQEELEKDFIVSLKKKLKPKLQ